MGRQTRWRIFATQHFAAQEVEHFKKRYAVYVPASKLWTYYESDTHAMSDSKRKGQVKVTQAARVRALLSEPPPTKPPTKPPPCAWHNC